MRHTGVRPVLRYAHVEKYHLLAETGLVEGVSPFPRGLD